jgi:acyl-coenzyme A synthetase/AMP-(fatty) acid ligase
VIEILSVLLDLERVIDEEHLRGGVRFIEKIPRNDLGKIVRHVLMKFFN